MNSKLNQLQGMEDALSRRLNGVLVNATVLESTEQDAGPVMRISIGDKEELPVFVTASPTQILCICYLWTETEIKAECRADMLEAMMDLNISIPLSNFGRIGKHYVIYGSLAADSRLDDVVTDIVMLADNALEALEVFTEYLK